jgi:plasmid stabilization system protein ParE
MSFELVVSPSAEADILDAFSWYEERQSGLGRRLISELDLAFARIQSEPLS